jgi:beta-glucosidase
VLGLSSRLEGEEMPVRIEGFAGGDRTSLDLPATQEALMEKVVAAGSGKPVVLVLLSGSAVAVNWADKNVPAIVQAWYPGAAGGTALADVLFGNTNPGGRLPVTFYRSVDQLPPFADYAMKGRTYRYFTGAPLYPFGHGLSYTRFRYTNLRIPSTASAGTPVEVTVDVQNAGETAGDEVVQVYLTALDAGADAPGRALKAFARVALASGEKKTVKFTLAPRDFSFVHADGNRVVQPGRFTVAIGGKQPGLKGTADATTTEVVSGAIALTGTPQTLSK